MATVKVGDTVTMRKKGKKPITWKKGGLHTTTHTPQGQKIPQSKIKKALAGGYGPKGKKQAQFDKNVLTGRKKNRRRTGAHARKRGR